VLENAEFIAWANENVVVVIGHKGSVHAPEKKDPKAPPAPEPAPEAETAGAPGECRLYPGLTCAEHEKIMEDATGSGTPKVEVKGYPTSYMVAPDGTFAKHTSDRQPKPCMDALVDYQKRFRLKITAKKFASHLAALADGDKAVAEGRWKDALAAYAKVDGEGKRLSSLQMELPAKVEALNAAVAAAFAKAKDGDAAPAPKRAAVAALRSAVAAKLSTGPLPVVAELDAWLAANPAPPPAK
jgi:hypothetical protein